MIINHPNFYRGRTYGFKSNKFFVYLSTTDSKQYFFQTGIILFNKGYQIAL